MSTQQEPPLIIESQHTHEATYAATAKRELSPKGGLEGNADYHHS